MKNVLLFCLFLSALPVPARAWLSNGSADLEVGKGQIMTEEDSIYRTIGVEHPCGVAIDPLHRRLFVADTENNRVVWWDMEGEQFLNGTIPNGVLGQPHLDATEANRGHVIAANTLKKPRAVAVDAQGNVWVVDSFNHRILRFSSDLTTGMSADLVLGQANMTSGIPNRGGKPAQNSLCCPRGISIDRQGNIWVADYGNNRVVRFSGDRQENGMNADLEFGQKDFSTASYNRNIRRGLPSPATLACPNAVSVDDLNNVWVVDSGNCRILRYPPEHTTGMEADLVLGQPGFKSAAGKDKKPATSAATLYFPNGIIADSCGIWVTDEFNHRVLRYLKPYSNGKDASLVIGQPDFTSRQPNRGNGEPTTIGLYRPSAAAVDTSGCLWIADSYNNRITCYRSDMRPVAAKPLLLNGILKEFYPDRRLKKKLQYRDGILEGFVREFFPDGRLKRENHYQNNVPQGIAREYYERGTLKSQVHFNAGVLDGPAYQYTEDGVLSAECLFKNGQAEGTARLFGTDGTVISEVDFINGIMIEMKEYGEDGTLKSPEIAPDHFSIE